MSSQTPETSHDEQSDTTRRSVLKAAGATAAVGLGGAAASGSAAARPTRRPVAADRAAIETVFDWHAGDLLEALAADGVIETADRSALDTRATSMDAVVGSQDGSAVVRDLDSGVHEVRTMREVSGGTLSIAVEVETGRAYAFYRPDSGGRYLYDVDAGYFGDEIGTQSHNCTCTCSPIACQGTRSEECECCDTATGECHTDHYCNC